MQTLEEYAARAELARQHAEGARDGRERDTFLEIAAIWERMADERRGQERSFRPRDGSEPDA